MIPLVQPFPPEFAERYRRAGYWRDETFPGMLRDLAARHAERTAVVGGDQRWSYAELADRAERAAAGFLALGLKPGDRVVVQLPNIPEFLSVVFGLFRAGLVPVYALPAHRVVEVVHFARTAEARAYVVAERHEGFDYRGLAEEVRRQVPAARAAGGPAPRGPFLVTWPLRRRASRVSLPRRVRILLSEAPRRRSLLAGTEPGSRPPVPRAFDAPSSACRGRHRTAARPTACGQPAVPGGAADESGARTCPIEPPASRAGISARGPSSAT